ncbi:MAG: 3-oxoadipate enol-lactonase [Alphaproteobacteria bacterium]|nr:3-oxoadipate enol-lactonase [Alphaproteobacteria bacterium]
MDRISANGIDIAYRFDGPSETAAATPCVMLCNGIMSNFSMWDQQIPALIDRYRVLRFDNRGHGGTELTPPPYSMETLAADACGLLDALGIDQVHFVGASLGGMVGQLFAVRHPERLKSLAFLGTLSVMGPVDMWNDRFTAVQSDGLAALMPTMMERWFTPEFSQSHADVVADVVANVTATAVDGYIGCGSAIRDMDQTSILKDIKAPTLVMGGGEDPGVPLSATAMIHESIPRAEKVIIEGARHLFGIEKPEETNRALRRFLDCHTPSLA